MVHVTSMVLDDNTASERGQTFFLASFVFVVVVVVVGCKVIFVVIVVVVVDVDIVVVDTEWVVD